MYVACDALIVLVVLKGLFGKQLFDTYIRVFSDSSLPVHMNDERNAGEVEFFL